jgi:hypothetical protein
MVLAAGCAQESGPRAPLPATEDAPTAVAELQPRSLVVFFVLDALRADHVGGHGWTPVIDRLMDGGVSFSDHTSAAASTKTYAKTLFSGQFFLDDGGLPTEVETLAKVISAAGYRTIGISGNGNVSAKFGLTRAMTSSRWSTPALGGQIR